MNAQEEANSFLEQWGTEPNTYGNATADGYSSQAWNNNYNNLSPDAKSLVDQEITASGGNVPSGGGAGIFSFVVNSESLSTLSTSLNTTADDIEGLINDIYAKIGELSSYWTGSAYDEFTSMCAKYRESLSGLVVLLQAFAKEFDILSQDSEDLVQKIKNALAE